MSDMPVWFKEYLQKLDSDKKNELCIWVDGDERAFDKVIEAAWSGDLGWPMAEDLDEDEAPK